mgnify:FL=1
MNQLWQMWSGGIAPQTCDLIIKACEELEPVPAVVGDGANLEQINTNVRRSEVRWAGDIKWINDLVMHFANRANKAAFGFDISFLEDIQYTIYNGTDEGYYDWHYDTFWANAGAFDRKLSVTIQLSNPSEYQGGEFLLDSQYEQPNPNDLKTRGTVLVFPSPITHTVKPVTSGVRKSLVAWGEGPKFK